MALTILSNIASVQAQRRLSQSTARLQKTFQRLSSGLRINTPSDDSAGLAIASGLNVDTRVFNQGTRNINDGISLLNIAEGSLNELSNIVVRLRELASQSANGTLASNQRRALDAEAQALSKEYTRIAQTTSFNNLNLLNGTNPGNSIQAGYGTSGSLAADVGGAIGDGTFAAFTTYTTLAQPTYAEIADLNADGNLDLAINVRTAGATMIYLGNGDATFKAPVSYTANTQPFHATFSDFNGDGMVDVVSSSLTDGALSVRLGNGDGTFKVATSVGAPASTHIPGVGDLNGDGLSDIVADGASNVVAVMLSNGNGTFRVTQTLTQISNPWEVQTDDLNNDGIADLSIISLADGVISVSLGNGDGTFRTSQTYRTGLGAAFSTSDFNNDGFLDILTGDELDDTLSLLYGNGDGTFKARSVINTGDGPKQPELGDFNGDGITDISVGNLNAGSVSIFLGNGNGTWRIGQTITNSGTVPGSPVADFNNDGVLDLFVASQSGNFFQILTGSSHSGTGPLLAFSLKTRYESLQAMGQFTTALNNINKQRGTVGALQSRYGYALNVIQQSSANFAEAASRIVDADVAEEAASLVSTKILQQAATAVLAQANTLPRTALDLLS